MSTQDAIEKVKRLGGIILLPSKEAYAEFMGDVKDVCYTRVYIDGVRVMFGNIDWEEVRLNLLHEKLILDHPDCKP